MYKLKFPATDYADLCIITVHNYNINNEVVMKKMLGNFTSLNVQNIVTKILETPFSLKSYNKINLSSEIQP